MQININEIQRPTLITPFIGQELTPDNEFAEYIDTTTINKSVTSRLNTSKKALKTKKSHAKSESLTEIEKEIEALKEEIEYWEQNGSINDHLRDTLAKKESIKKSYIKNCKKLGVKP